MVDSTSLGAMALGRLEDARVEGAWMIALQRLEAGVGALRPKFNDKAGSRAEDYMIVGSVGWPPLRISSSSTTDLFRATTWPSAPKTKATDFDPVSTI